MEYEYETGRDVILTSFVTDLDTEVVPDTAS